MKRSFLLLTLFFANTASYLIIPATEHSHSNLQNTDPIPAAVNSFGKHPSHSVRKV